MTACSRCFVTVPTVRPEVQADEDEILCDPCAQKEVERLRDLFDCLRQVHCEGCAADECMVCGVLMCPVGEPLHYHHDGCPECDAPVLLREPAPDYELVCQSCGHAVDDHVVDDKELKTLVLDHRECLKGSCECKQYVFGGLKVVRP